MVYLITGKAGSGKTTRAYQMREKLRLEHKQCVVIDGDTMRRYFKTGFSDKDRQDHIERMGRIARLLETQDVIVIISAMLPKREWRDSIRSHFSECEVIYIEGGTLWEGTVYEEPTSDELS